MALDHGTLNLPLAKRGDIDKQIDAYKAGLAHTAKTADEASRIAADLAYNADKDAGGPARRNQERAMALQMRQSQTNEGFFV